MEEKRILLRNRGKINPEKAEEYIERGGYKGLEKVLRIFQLTLRSWRKEQSS